MELTVSRIIDSLPGHPEHYRFAVLLLLGVVTAVVISTMYGRQLFALARKKLTKVRLRFVAYDRSTVWFGEMTNHGYVVSLKGVWKVINASKRGVVLRSFQVDGIPIDHHILSNSNSQETGALIPPRGSIDVEAFCLVRRTFTWRSGPFVADIYLVDDDDAVHTIKNARFNDIRPSAL